MTRWTTPTMTHIIMVHNLHTRHKCALVLKIASFLLASFTKQVNIIHIPTIQKAQKHVGHYKYYNRGSQFGQVRLGGAYYVYNLRTQKLNQHTQLPFKNLASATLTCEVYI